MNEAQLAEFRTMMRNTTSVLMDAHRIRQEFTEIHAKLIEAMGIMFQALIELAEAEEDPRLKALLLQSLDQAHAALGQTDP